MARRWQRKKWDESDFALVVEDFTTALPRRFTVMDGRVLSVPLQKKAFKSYRQPVAVCIHDKPLQVDCATCDFEAPGVLRRMGAGDG